MPIRIKLPGTDASITVPQRARDANRWLAKWLDRPLPALGGRQPAHVLQEAGGFEEVYAILARMQRAYG